MAKARKIGCNDWVEPANRCKTVKEPGIYVLRKAIDNPNYDRRSGDWHKQPQIAPGTFFVLEGWNEHGGVRITKNDGRGYDRIESHFHCYEPLLNALEKVEGSHEQWVAWNEQARGYEGNPDAILVALMKAGYVTREQITKAGDFVKAEEIHEGGLGDHPMKAAVAAIWELAPRKV